MKHVRDIPKISSDEARTLAAEELRRMLALLETLEGEEWHQPTACAEWDVRDIVAHQAGAWASYARWGEFFRQLVFNPLVLQADEPVDGINKRQILDRAERSTDDLIAELREAGPKAINTRQGLPAVLRWPRFPAGDPAGPTSIGDLMDIIYTRDIWTHRMDICEATGRDFEVTEEHDGRISEDVLRSVGKVLTEHLNGRTVGIIINGDAGGTYYVGPGDTPDATLTFDLIPFHQLGSRRLQPAEVLDKDLVYIEGDEALARLAVSHIQTLY